MRDVRFLVVDDSSMARKLMTGVIRNKLGAETVLTASDGKEAIRILGNNPVDLIISDWNMGEVNGDELLQYVRSQPKYRDIPFIMVTTNNQRDFIVTALQLGVSQYVVKPFTAAELEKKILSSWNAANKRRNDRYSALPDHRATLRIGAESRAAEVIDISSSGSLVRTKYGTDLRLYESCELALAITDPHSGKNWAVSGVKGICVRIEADNPSVPSCRVALEFAIGETDANAEGLAGVLKFLHERSPEVITN